MQRPAAVMSDDIMRSTTFIRSSALRSAIELGQNLSLDPQAEARTEAQLCRLCYYRVQVAGQAFTFQPCMSCHESQQYASTMTDSLCLKCARAGDLCKRCGCDIDLDPKRTAWPVPLVPNL